MLPSAGSLLKCWLCQSCPELGTGMAGSHGLEHDWLPARGHISKKLELGLPQEHSPVTLLWVHIANGTFTAVSNAHHCSYPHISQIHTYLLYMLLKVFSMHVPYPLYSQSLCQSKQIQQNKEKACTWRQQ